MKNILPIAVISAALVLLGFGLFGFRFDDHTPQADCEFVQAHMRPDAAQHGPKYRARFCAGMLADDKDAGNYYHWERARWEWQHE